MPSQITHALFAEDTLPPRLRQRLKDRTFRGWLVLGAQGPDLFYHNQRRKPRSIQYGTLLHRHGYGYLVEAMLQEVLKRGQGYDGSLAAYIYGFAGHAVLDRALHPYINFRAGRPVAGRPETEKLRSMHAFLERLVDVALLRKLRGIHPNEYDFYGTIEPLADGGGDVWKPFMYHAMAAALTRAAEDKRLEERVENTWLDAFGYYEFTRNVDKSFLEEGLRRQEAGLMRPQWLSIIHPPNIPADLDVLNLEGHQWLHPCSSKRVSTMSIPEMYEEAAGRAGEIVDRIARWMETRTAGPGDAAVSLVGDYNLSDGRPRRRPCRPRHMDPLPLPHLQHLIRNSIRDGRGGIVQSLQELNTERTAL
jgi:hypothetical protein